MTDDIINAIIILKSLAQYNSYCNVHPDFQLSGDDVFWNFIIGDKKFKRWKNMRTQETWDTWEDQ